MGIFKNKVFVIGLISSVLTASLELFVNGSSPSLWVLGFSLGTVAISYFAKNVPGQAGTIAGILAAQVGAFAAAHTAPTGITTVEVLKYVIPVITAVLGVYAQTIKPTDKV